MKKIVWFARGGDFLRCGPYNSQIEAVKAMRLAPPKGMSYIWCKSDVPRYPNNMFVWPEEITEKKK